MALNGPLVVLDLTVGGALFLDVSPVAGRSSSPPVGVLIESVQQVALRFHPSSCPFVCVPELLPGVGGQGDAVLPHVQEAGLHLGPAQQQEEHAGGPEAVGPDPDLLPSAVSAPPERAGG